MSTRAVVTFKDAYGEYSVYKHCDGYPNGDGGMIAAIHAAEMNAWKLPRFEADEFAAAFVAANKDGPGYIRLTSGPMAHGDLAYTYLVTCPDGKLHIAVNPSD
jgi:hypothetical protein